MLSIEEKVGAEKLIKIKRLLLPSEIRLDSFPTKSKFNWICDIYYHRSACLFYQFCVYVCTSICLCIAFSFASSLGGGYVKAYFIIVQPNLARQLVLLGIPWISILFQCGGINP